jgi:hypothetical protein
VKSLRARGAEGSESKAPEGEASTKEEGEDVGAREVNNKTETEEKEENKEDEEDEEGDEEDEDEDEEEESLAAVSIDVIEPEGETTGSSKGQGLRKSGPVIPTLSLSGNVGKPVKKISENPTQEANGDEESDSDEEEESGGLDGSGSKKRLKMPTPRIYKQVLVTPGIKKKKSETPKSKPPEDGGLDGSGSKKKLKMPTPRVYQRVVAVSPVPRAEQEEEDREEENRADEQENGGAEGTEGEEGEPVHSGVLDGTGSKKVLKTPTPQPAKRCSRLAISRDEKNTGVDEKWKEFHRAKEMREKKEWVQEGEEGAGEGIQGGDAEGEEGEGIPLRPPTPRDSSVDGKSFLHLFILILRPIVSEFQNVTVRRQNFKIRLREILFLTQKLYTQKND